MSLLQRVLMAFVGSKAQDAASAAAEPDGPEYVTTSLRIPADVRRQYEALAEQLGISLQQSILLSLRALAEQGWRHPETNLIAKRIQRALTLHDIHAVDVNKIHPALNAEALHDESTLLRIATRELTEAVGKALYLNPKWFAGENFASPVIDGWYNNPHSPIKWAQKYSNRTIIAYVVRIQGGKWNQSIPEDDYNNQLPQNQMALILHSFEDKCGISYPVYRMWSFERMTYERARLVARIILSRLAKLDLQLRGITISETLYQDFQDDNVLPIELVKNRIEYLGWSVAPLLYGAEGPYRDEDRYLHLEAWAGGHEFPEVSETT